MLNALFSLNNLENYHLLIYSVNQYNIIKSSFLLSQ